MRHICNLQWKCMIELKEYKPISSIHMIQNYHTYLSAKYRIITKCPKWGGLNDPANTTVISFSRLRRRELSDDMHQGKERIVGKSIRKTSIPTAIIAAPANAIAKYASIWRIMVIELRCNERYRMLLFVQYHADLPLTILPAPQGDVHFNMIPNPISNTLGR